jgi:hypothetical protein
MAFNNMKEKAMTQWNEKGIKKACKDVKKWLARENREMARHVVEEVLENYLCAGGFSSTPQPELEEIYNILEPLKDGDDIWQKHVGSRISECLTKLTALMEGK